MPLALLKLRPLFRACRKNEEYSRLTILRSNLVLGATGAVGQFLLPLLIARRERVIGISRDSSCVDQAGIEWLHGDLFGAMPPLPQVDTLYSLGPLDAFADWFARTLAAQTRAPAHAAPRRVIALSSMSAASKQDSIEAAERELAARLASAEQRLFACARERNIACTIFRPTLIYGSGRDASLAPLARFARRWRVLPIPRGASGLRQPVHAADLAAACLAARDVSATFGNTYALGGGECLRFDAMFARIARASHALRVPIPLALVRAGARLARGRVGVGALARMTADLVADNAPAARDFGYAPRGFVAADVLHGLREGDATGAAKRPSV